jgi:hypothetical protein
MGDGRIAFGMAVGLIALATGCGTSTLGQVQEGELGTYSIHIDRTSGLTQGTAATNAAIDKAGAYCHAKGQKLVIVPNPSSLSVVTFRCAAPV